ncbi:hypothetical protein LCGC14_0164710 [marine sediment metagenome]|uniref:Uncharacterized protein n=1 Tax=marine sediment metagenome TaxID=412755 RepID=A0A0F9VAQ8_9ZZZZ
MDVFQDTLDLLQEVQQAQLNRAARRFEISPDEVEAIVRDADPTPNMKYGTWLLKQWLSHQDPMRLQDENIRSDISELLGVHARLVTLKTAGDWEVKPNLFDYKSWREAWGALQEVPEGAILSRRQLRKGKADPMLVPGSEFVAQEGKYRAYIVTTPDAAMFHGRGTPWCTRARNQACHYASEDNPLIVVHYVWSPERTEAVYQATSDYREVQDSNHNEMAYDQLPHEVQVLFEKAAETTGNSSTYVEWAKASEGAIEEAWDEWIKDEYRDGLIEKFPDLEDEIEELVSNGRLWGLFDDAAGSEITTTWYGDNWDVDVDIEDAVAATDREAVRFAFDPRRREWAAQHQQQTLPFSGTLPRESLKADVYRILVA